MELIRCNPLRRYVALTLWLEREPEKAKLPTERNRRILWGACRQSDAVGTESVSSDQVLAQISAKGPYDGNNKHNCSSFRLASNIFRL